jgi:hypothetical protein
MKWGDVVQTVGDSHKTPLQKADYTPANRRANRQRQNPGLKFRMAE